MELLRQQFIAYRPWNEQEERDREELLRRLDSHEDLYTRANTAAHFTASAWVVSPDRKQVLMATPTETGICWPWRCGRSGRKAVSRRSAPCPRTCILWKS